MMRLEAETERNRGRLRSLVASTWTTGCRIETSLEVLADSACQSAVESVSQLRLGLGPGPGPGTALEGWQHCSFSLVECVVHSGPAAFAPLVAAEA